MDPIDEEFIAYYQKVGKACGFDDLAATIFARLFLEPGEIAMSDLAEETGYSLASISNKLKILEHTGLISRRTKPGTRRVYISVNKGIMKVFIWQLQQVRSEQTQPAMADIPRIISRFENEDLPEEQKEKLATLKRYYDDMTKIDLVIDEIIKKLQADQA